MFSVVLNWCIAWLWGLVDGWVGCGRLVWLSVSCLLGVYGGCCLGFCLYVCVWLLMVWFTWFVLVRVVMILVSLVGLWCWLFGFVGVLSDFGLRLFSVINSVV